MSDGLWPVAQYTERSLPTCQPKNSSLSAISHELSAALISPCKLSTCHFEPPQEVTLPFNFGLTLSEIYFIISPSIFWKNDGMKGVRLCKQIMAGS
jgi:hypothetical protein